MYRLLYTIRHLIVARGHTIVSIYVHFTDKIIAKYVKPIQSAVKYWNEPKIITFVTSIRDTLYIYIYLLSVYEC